MNKTILIGRLARNLDLQKTQTGMSVIRTAVAVDRINKDKGVDFVPIVIYGGTADAMHSFLHKGDRIGVEGHIRIDSRETQDGKRTFFDVIAEKVEFLGSSQRPEQHYSTPEDYHNVPVTATQLPQQLNQGQDEEDIMPDDLPF